MKALRQRSVCLRDESAGVEAALYRHFSCDTPQNAGLLCLDPEPNIGFNLHEIHVLSECRVLSGILLVEQNDVMSYMDIAQDHPGLTGNGLQNSTLNQSLSWKCSV